MEDYKEKYEMALEGIQEILSSGQDSIKMPQLQLRLQGIFPELQESEDEKIRKDCISIINAWADACRLDGDCCEVAPTCIAWLEKQGESYTKKDVDDAYLKGISDAKNELEKQGTPAKLSEEEQNSFAKGVLSNCALSFINYLDAHSYEGKMCVSNGECEDIENAFHNAMWDRLHRYYCKYIEKQGEQKPAVTDFKAKDWYVSKVDGKIHDMTYNPTDKVEPKFNVGDWITDGNITIQIEAIKNDCYLYCGDCVLYSTKTADKVYHIWTIQDAKDGDVLAVERDKTPFIFKEFDKFHPGCPVAYCGIDDSGIFVNSGEGWWTDEEVYPATKEQRDTLEKAMAYAGYTFDFEKKELKKIEDEIEIPFGAKDSELQESTYYIPDGFHAEIDDDKVIIKKGEKSTEWSEEDENYLQSAENACEYQYGKNTSTILWLKSLKDRIGG